MRNVTDASRFADRVNVYIDFQNAYEAARSVFHTRKEPGRAGTFHPLALAHQLVGRSERARVLQDVRVYRGLPSREYERLTFEAASRQIERWRRGGVEVITRPLSYQQNSTGGRRSFEKGIDVSLAIDVLQDALDDKYDVGIVVSCDTDIVPAIERVLQVTDKRIEVVGWRGPHGITSRLGNEHRRLWAHWIDEATYKKIADNTNYTVELSESDAPLSEAS